MKPETEIIKDIEAMLAPYAVSEEDALELSETTLVHRLLVEHYKLLLQDLVDASRTHHNTQSLRIKLSSLLTKHNIVPDHSPSN